MLPLSLLACILSSSLFLSVSASSHSLNRRHHNRATFSRRTNGNDTTAKANSTTISNSINPASTGINPTSTGRMTTSTGKTSVSTSRTSTSTGSTSTSTSSTATGSLAALIPVSVVSQWSTSSSASSALELSDATLNPFDVASGMTHAYGSAPDGKYSMQADYPKGSYTPSHTPKGGFSFYAPGPASVDLSTAKEATFGYSVYFPTGFDFVKGGKLPGLYGGDSASAAIGCSGGRQATDCFSARLMWRTSGAGEMYVYLPDWTANDQLCTMANSECNSDYGTSISRGAFTFPTGQWTTVSSRVKLNDAGKANAELELFVAGKSVIKATGLQIRADSSGRIRGIQMQTFFGGATSAWASTSDQKVYFSDFSVGIVSTL